MAKVKLLILCVAVAVLASVISGVIVGKAMLRRQAVEGELRASSNSPPTLRELRHRVVPEEVGVHRLVTAVSMPPDCMFDGTFEIHQAGEVKRSYAFVFEVDPHDRLGAVTFSITDPDVMHREPSADIDVSFGLWKQWIKLKSPGVKSIYWPHMPQELALKKEDIGREVVIGQVVMGADEDGLFDQPPKPTTPFHLVIRGKLVPRTEPKDLDFRRMILPPVRSDDN